MRERDKRRGEERGERGGRVVKWQSQDYTRICMYSFTVGSSSFGVM